MIDSFTSANQLPMFETPKIRLDFPVMFWFKSAELLPMESQLYSRFIDLSKELSSILMIILLSLIKLIRSIQNSAFDTQIFFICIYLAWGIPFITSSQFLFDEGLNGVRAVHDIKILPIPLSYFFNCCWGSWWGHQLLNNNPCHLPIFLFRIPCAAFDWFVISVIFIFSFYPLRCCIRNFIHLADQLMILWVCLKRILQELPLSLPYLLVLLSTSKLIVVCWVCPS